MKKSKLLLLLVLFFSFNRVYASLDICTPSDEYLEYEKLSDEDKKNYVEPTYCKEIMNKYDTDSFSVFKRNLKKGNSLSSTINDISYDARNDNIVTSVKNQYNLGACWAFSAISVVETNALKNNLSEYDFSEKHMIYSLLSAAYSDLEGQKGKYLTNNFDGGKITYAASYYFNGIGQLLESDWPYENNSNKITINDYKKGNNIISVGTYKVLNVNNYSKCTNNEISNIKNEIINNGSVQASMYMDEGLFKSGDLDYYLATTSNSAFPNHAITIVGWDDSIAKENFTNATKDGAWIIKNSWGNTWSDDGYFYVSYDDNFICKSVAAFSNVSTTTFDNTYKSADMVGIPEFTFNNTFYISSKFDKENTNKEQIKRVNISAGEYMSYYVYLVEDGQINNQENWKLLGSGVSNNYSVVSIDVDDTLIEDDFTIIVKYVVNTSKVSSIFTMCNNEEETSAMQISADTNYYSFDGNDWQDMNNILANDGVISCEPNIFVYTDDFSEVIPNLSISSVNLSEDNATFNLELGEINVSGIVYKIKDKNNNDITDNFNIVTDYNTNKVIITPNNNISGKYKLVIEYDGKSIESEFEIEEIIRSIDSSVSINLNNMFVSISNNYTLVYSDLISKLEIKNTSIELISPDGNKLSTDNAVTTNTKVKTNNNEYVVVIMGDLTGDGRINSGDLLQMRKYLLEEVNLTGAYKQAGIIESNGEIKSLDLLRLRQYLLGEYNFK